MVVNLVVFVVGLVAGLLLVVGIVGVLGLTVGLFCERIGGHCTVLQGLYCGRQGKLC